MTTLSSQRRLGSSISTEMHAKRFVCLRMCRKTTLDPSLRWDDNEHGGFVLPFLALLILILPLFFFLVDFAQTRLITMRMNRVILQPASKDILLPQNQLGITSALIEDDKLIVSYKPYFPLGDSLTRISLNLPLKQAGIPHLVVALDVFIPEGQGSLTDFYESLFKELEEWVARGNKLTVIPYAASINLGTNQVLTFPAAVDEDKNLAKDSPVRALLKNRLQQKSLGQIPKKSLWSGCISLKRRCDFEHADPFFVPSTFARRPQSVIRGAKHEGFMVTGANNWTESTIREDYATYGAFVMTPNLGCPQQLGNNISDPEEYLMNLKAVRRGGSLLPLALDYGLKLLEQYEGPKILLMTKITDDMCYVLENIALTHATQKTGYPKGDGPDLLGCADSPQNMLDATRIDLQKFKQEGGIVAGFFERVSAQFTDLVDQKYLAHKGQEKKLFRLFE